MKYNWKHGESKLVPEYRAWENMKARCLNKNFKYFKYYGGRGIKVCSKWINNYNNFIKDVGRRPSDKYSLDRINNNGNYTPQNVRWATDSQQNLNRRKFGGN